MSVHVSEIWNDVISSWKKFYIITNLWFLKEKTHKDRYDLFEVSKEEEKLS